MSRASKSNLGLGDQLRREAAFELPVDSSIYHYTRAPRELMNRGRFDYVESRHHGAFYFTDEIVADTNCRVNVIAKCLLLKCRQLQEPTFEQIKELGGGSRWVGASALGFDGTITQTGDLYTIKDEANGECSQEIVIFRPSLHKLRPEHYPLP